MKTQNLSADILALAKQIYSAIIASGKSWAVDFAPETALKAAVDFFNYIDGEVVSDSRKYSPVQSPMFKEIFTLLDSEKSQHEIICESYFGYPFNKPCLQVPRMLYRSYYAMDCLSFWFFPADSNCYKTKNDTSLECCQWSYF